MSGCEHPTHQVISQKSHCRRCFGTHWICLRCGRSVEVQDGQWVTAKCQWGYK